MYFLLSDGHESIDTRDYGLEMTCFSFKLTRIKWLMASIIINLTGPRMVWDVSLWACL